MAVVLNKNDIIQEAYELYTRLILLQQPPFVLQKSNKYKVDISEELNCARLYLKEDYDFDFKMDLAVDSLFFLSDGYIVSFIDGDISQAKLYAINDGFNKFSLVSISDFILIPPVLEKSKQYVELGDLNLYNGKEIRNFSELNIKFSSGTVSDFYDRLSAIQDNQRGKLSQAFYFDELIFDDKKAMELINALHTNLYIDTLYLCKYQYWNIDFKNITVNKIIISEGTIGISFSKLNYSINSGLDIVLPKSLKYLGQMSFYRCSFNSINLEDLEDFYIGNAAFQSAKLPKDKEYILDLSKCLYLGIESFKSSPINNVIVAENTVIDTESFSKSELKSFELVKTNRKIMYDDKIYKNYVTNLNDIILENNLHKFTYYNDFEDCYLINEKLFMFCGNLSNIYVPCNKVVFNSKSISFVSPNLKISGMKEYVIEDIYNTLLCKKWVIIDNYVYDYFEAFIKHVENDAYIFYKIYEFLVFEGYITHMFNGGSECDLTNILNIIVDVLIDYIFNILSNCMEEDYYEYSGNIPYLNLKLIGKKNRPEIDLKNLVFDILSDWSRGYQYNEKEEFITNRNCNVNATVRL